MSEATLEGRCSKSRSSEFAAPCTARDCAHLLAAGPLLRKATFRAASITAFPATEDLIAVGLPAARHRGPAHGPRRSQGQFGVCGARLSTKRPRPSGPVQTPFSTRISPRSIVITGSPSNVQPSQML